jgi:transcriptional regulator with GAF, ATPase, and Fis domain
VFSLLDKLAPHDSLVLIRGESGTGKELIADALHAGSSRAGRPFVKVNCGALVETLLLSELFGHERGAFTGALQRKKGRFEAADGGTIFLDEIGDISPKTQVALLRVLQEREFERVGGNVPVKVDVRILCATNRNLEQMVARGEFREDLYYRLKGIQIELPSLRERLDDLALLAESFLTRVAEERGGEKKTLAPDALALLERYGWPGNVRELENVIRSVSLFADGTVIGVRDFADYTEIFRGIESTPAPPRSARAVEPAPLTEPQQPAGWARLGAEKLSLKALKTKIEMECIQEALEATGGNITRAAERLGMKRPRLSQLIKQYRITVTGGGQTR